MNIRMMTTAAAMAMAACGTPALAGRAGEPIDLADEVSLDPIVDATIRYEFVDQAGIAANADAITARLRVGGELRAGGITVLAEGEGNLALVDHYNDTLPGNGVEPFPTVADPESLELNRLQIGYAAGGFGITVGRQRIIHGNARFVGNVGWRQNEQTFDAVRARAALGAVSIDAAYAISQRTVFGSDSPNSHFDGDLVLLSASIDSEPVKLDAYAYLIDYDTRVAFSSQTYGLRASRGFKIGSVGMDLAAGIAIQRALGANPVSYRAEYYALEATATAGSLTLRGGYEELGSDGGGAAFQTPLATLHAFNGWADLFLTTPTAGLRDSYAGLGWKPKVKALPGFNIALTWHDFSSDVGGVNYGEEWDFSVGLKLGKVAMLAKYADYQARAFGADTSKLWLQASVTI